MSVTIAPQYTQREYRWTAWKAIYVIKGLPFQFEETSEMYTIWSYDGPEVFSCQIYRGAVPAVSDYTQEQNDADKADFETNYKALGNASIDQIDSDGAQIVRVKAAKRGWSYWACGMEVTTSKLSPDNLMCKDSLGVDIAGVSCKIFKPVSGVLTEILTAGTLDANLNACTRTVVDFEPPFDYEIIGGALRINSDISASDIRIWIVAAPDIPANMGGSKEMATSLNLKYLAPGNALMVDGRVSKFLKYNATYHTNKIRVIVEHPPGYNLTFSLSFETYRQ
jgi:hypothetical protein